MAYHYTPLNENNTEIRLLHLLPGKREDAITILIEHKSFTDDNIPDYEALSYTWGDPGDRANIAIGRRQEHSLSVTKNLAEALPYLRRGDTSRTFWIDAICVNQADLDERSRQVSLMASLYSHARTVVVWLGPEAQNSDDAFSCIELLSKKVKIPWDRTTLICLTEEENWADERLLLPFSERELVALEHIFSGPWFERLWVWQEVRFGGERAMVQCGDRLLEWQTFPNALRWLKEPHTAARRPSPKFLLGALRICDPRSYHLCGLLGHARSLECQDPRDKLSAILSHLEGSQSLLHVHADYSRPVSEAYTNAATEWISRYNNLKMLEYIMTPQTIPNLPSWVPDWTMEHIQGAQQPFSIAFCSSSSKAPWGFYENKLKVVGKHVGTIKAVQPVLEGTSWGAVRDFVDRISALDGFFQQSLSTRHGLEALCQALYLGDFADCYEPVNRSRPPLPHAVEALARALPLLDRVMDKDYYSNKSYRRFWTNVSYVCWRRSLVLLENGSLGIAPANAMPGDHVYVLLGCDSAMTLRNAENNAFRVIGSTYVDGFMQGEAILGSIPAHFKPVLRTSPVDGIRYWGFRDEAKGVILSEDPRLGSLPLGWKRLSKAFANFWPRFEDEHTGETRIFNQDPRCDPENLVARGVELQTLELV